MFETVSYELASSSTSVQKDDFYYLKDVAIAEYCGKTSKEVDYIGRHKLPVKVRIDFERDEDDVICATCNELGIVSCATSEYEAEHNLESELKDAIDLYVHVMKENDLDPHALQYRQKLYEIERMNAP